MTTYWVIAASRNGAESHCTGDLFASPFQAANSMKSTYLHGGYKWGVRPATWHEREQAMFANHIYQQPVWSEESWWRDHHDKFAAMYVHISLQDPNGIAFTEDAVKGEADRQTTIRPGRFLQKYLGAGKGGITIEHGPLQGWSAVITKQQIAYYAAWHQTGARPLSDDSLHFTDDEDEMVRVYDTGPPSCMANKTSWRKEDHPVRVYAAGDLSLAYLTSTSGAVIARALCWPAKAVFGRVYPTPGSAEERDTYNEMMARLKGLGWTSIEEDGCVFDGARLQDRENQWGNTIMPYLDHGYGVWNDYIDGKHYYVMSRTEPHQENTDGTLHQPDDDEDDEPDWTCDHCNDGYGDDDDHHIVYGMWFLPAGRQTGYPRYEQTWCNHCYENGSFYCEGSEVNYRDSQDSVQVDGGTYNQDWLLANGGWQCSWSNDYFLRGVDEPVVLADGSLIHVDYLEEGAFQCLDDGAWWPISEASSAVPGYTYDHDRGPVHPVEIEMVMPALPDDPEDLQAWAAACLDTPPWPLGPPPEGYEAAKTMTMGEVVLRPVVDLRYAPLPIIPVGILVNHAS